MSEILIRVGDSDLSIGAELDIFGNLPVQVGEGDTAQRTLLDTQELRHLVHHVMHLLCTSPAPLPAQPDPYIKEDRT